MAGLSQAGLKALMELLLKKGGKKLSRLDFDPKTLAREGFQESRQITSPPDYAWGESRGLHFADNPADIDTLLSGLLKPPSRPGRANVEAVALPGSRSREFSAEEWKENLGRNRIDITKELKDKYDFVTYPDLNNIQAPERIQTVQLNPKKSVARIKGSEGWIYRLLGATGATGATLGTGMMEPDSAEAMTPKQIWKAVKPLMQKLHPDRQDQADIAKAVYNTPRDILEGINKVSTKRENYFDVRPNVRGYADYKGTIGINPNMKDPTPGVLPHELGHFITMEGNTPSTRRYQKPDILHDSPTLRYRASKSEPGGVSVPNMEEASAQIIGQRLMGRPFHESVDPFVDQYLKDKGGKFLRALGPIIAGSSLTDSLSPDEAEAMPLGKVLPGVWKTFSQALRKEGTEVNKKALRTTSNGPIESTTSDILKGQALEGGTISGVYKGLGDKRFIHLEDGRIFPTDKRSVHDLTAEFGTQKYINRFMAAEGDPIKQQEMALKSLAANEKWAEGTQVFTGKSGRQSALDYYFLDRSKMLRGNLSEQDFVQSLRTKKWFMMPRVYTPILEEMGLIKVDRDWLPKGGK